MVIYKATNKINGKCYIGKTVRSLEVRIFHHKCLSKRSAKIYFHNAIKKYGIQSFEWSIIDTAETEEILNEKEIYWIKFLNTKSPNGYNLTDGGEGISGWIPTKESRKKLSEVKMGKKRKPFTEETRNKMRESKKGKKLEPHTEEWKQNISKTMLGKKRGSYKKKEKINE